ncbi:MAG TPA: tetratricopeptide repeat protein, partial [Xanthomonadales bacterium]|nr:tetratricopeptide repeat protein [Xanthomonadales bacterium]
MHPDSAQDAGIDVFRVGDLAVDFVRREVRRGQDVLPVKGLSFELLACLVRHHPDLATLRQINEEVWGENVVTPAALSQRVKLLREGLGSSSEYPQYIEVVKSRGYRLVVPVEASDSAQDSFTAKPPQNIRYLVLIVAVMVIAFAAYLGLGGPDNDPQQASDAEFAQLPGAQAGLARDLGVSEEVYDLYRRATYHGRAYSVPEIQKGIGLLDRALELEPNFAHAYGARATLYAWSGTPSYGWMSPDEAFKRAREDALRAIALDPSVDWALVVLGDILLWHEWNAEAAEQAYRKAMETNPQSSGARFSLAFLMGALGRHDEAIGLALEGVELEPLKAGSYTNLGWRFIGARRYEEAIAAANRALELEPGMIDAIVIKTWSHTYL